MERILTNLVSNAARHAKDRKTESPTAYVLEWVAHHRPEAHQRALSLEIIADTAPCAQVIALLDRLSQDASHIIKTIHFLKNKK